MSGTGIKGNQIADGTVQGVDIDWDPSLTMKGHIIPDTNAAYDLGNAEYKIRHLFLSDNSLWIGDDHKVDIDASGRKKTRKRKKSSVPHSLYLIRDAHTRTSDSTGLPITLSSLIVGSPSVAASKVAAKFEIEAITGKPLADTTALELLAYARSIDGHPDPASLTIHDIFDSSEDDDWEEIVDDGEGVSPDAPAPSLFLRSTTPSSTKVFEITVDDSGTITATEVP